MGSTRSSSSKPTTCTRPRWVRSPPQLQRHPGVQPSRPPRRVGGAVRVGRGFEFRPEPGSHLGTTRAVGGELALGIIRPVLHGFLVNVSAGRGAGGHQARPLRPGRRRGDGALRRRPEARGDVLIGVDGLQLHRPQASFSATPSPDTAGTAPAGGIVEPDWPRMARSRNFLGIE